MTITPEQVQEFARLKAGGMPLRKIMRSMGVGYESTRAIAAALALASGAGASAAEKTRHGAGTGVADGLPAETPAENTAKNAGGFPPAGSVVAVAVVRGRGIPNSRVVLGRVVSEKWPVKPVTVRVRSNEGYTPLDFKGSPFVFEARVEGDGNLAELIPLRAAGRPWPLKNTAIMEGAL